MFWYALVPNWRTCLKFPKYVTEWIWQYMWTKKKLKISVRDILGVFWYALVPNWRTFLKVPKSVTEWIWQYMWTKKIKNFCTIFLGVFWYALVPNWRTCVKVPKSVTEWIWHYMWTKKIKKFCTRFFRGVLVCSRPKLADVLKISKICYKVNLTILHVDKKY